MTKRYEIDRLLPGHGIESSRIETIIDGIDLSVESFVRNGVMLCENFTEEADRRPEDAFLEPGYTVPAVRLTEQSAAAVLRTTETC